MLLLDATYCMATKFFTQHKEEFKFGWEVELMVTDSNFTPLFGKTLPFEKVMRIISSLDLPVIDYLEAKYVGSGQNCCYVEGFETKVSNDLVKSVDVKGIEIRTPISFSIPDSVNQFEQCYLKVHKGFQLHELEITCFGNHPFQPHYSGPRLKRSIVDWASAEVAMTTHGLAINISLPERLEKKLNREKLECRFSYAAPIMVLFSADTPFRMGQPWKYGNNICFSERSYRRSFTRNTFYLRNHENYRKEITLFDMTNELNRYLAYASLSLGIILSNRDFPVIPEHFSRENVRRVAVNGYGATLVDRNFATLYPSQVAREVLSACCESLQEYNFDSCYLDILWDDLDKELIPAQSTLEKFEKSNSIQEILRQRSNLIKGKLDRGHI